MVHGTVAGTRNHSLREEPVAAPVNEEDEEEEKDAVVPLRPRAGRRRVEPAALPVAQR